MSALAAWGQPFEHDALWTKRVWGPCYTGRYIGCTMSNNPPSWPNGAPPPETNASPFQPLQPPPYGTYSQGYPGPDARTPSGLPGSAAQPQGTQPYGAQPGQFDPAAQPHGAQPGQFDPAAQPYPGQPGYPPYGAPQAPLGPPPPAPVSIESFAPRRDRRPFIIVGLAALLLTGALIAAIVLGTRPPALPATPTASPHSSSAPRSPAPNGQSVAFESTYDHAKGYWQITKQSWDSSGVLLNLSVRMDEGALTPVFFVFNNDTNAQYRVDLALAPSPQFPAGNLASPRTYTGNIYVPMPHVDGTLIMISGRQSDAISALAIKK